MDEKKSQSLFSLATDGSPQTSKDDYKKVAAWFLGPKAENKDFFMGLLQKSMSEHAELRESYYPDEEAYIDDSVKKSDQYVEMCAILEDKRAKLSKRLKQSVPFFSQKYQGHMNWDTLMAGSLGYMTAMLYNQNNVATEASPVTSKLEQEVGTQLCELLGYDKEKSWGHITADGTIANIEAMWAARNLKTLPLAIREMIRSNPILEKERDELTVNFSYKTDVVKKLLVKCTNWQLLNINIDDSLTLMDEISCISGIPLDDLNELLKPHLLATKGIAYYAKTYPEFAEMKIFVPVTHHYSWPKAGTLLGIGEENVIGIPVDEYCKMDVGLLEKELERCFEREHPVIMVVAVIGSTAEGAVDDLVSINKMKKGLADKGLQFNLHCDAAWGGYLRSMLIEPPSTHISRMCVAHFVPTLPLSYYAIAQYETLYLADTITIDPHKSGYIPYSAGALCYRNKRLRSLITFNASYIHSESDTNMGIYGVEGSKPGATAAAVWLAHATVPLNRLGYGQILGECCYTAKIYYCYWLTLQGDIDLGEEGVTDRYKFCILPLIQLPPRIESSDSSITPFCCREEMIDYIKENIIDQSIESIAEKPRAMLLLQNIGSDVLMNSFVVNFSNKEGMNTDYSLMNELNENLFEKFSFSPDRLDYKPDYVLMMNTLSSSQYGSAFKHIKEGWHLNVKDREDYKLNVLVNTILQPWPNTPEFIRNVMDTFTEGVISSLKKIPKEKRV